MPKYNRIYIVLLLGLSFFGGCLEETSPKVAEEDTACLDLDCTDNPTDSDELEETATSSDNDTDTEETSTVTETETTDLDGDGYTVENGDCDDTMETVYPGASDEQVDGVDQNCDGVDGVDEDGDGVASQLSGGTDCDDQDANISPMLEESCDLIDNDCDGILNNDRDCLVYVHTSSNLYLVDPFMLTIDPVTTVPGLFDFDTDLDGNLYGITPWNLQVFDATNSTWSQVALLNHSGGTPNGFAIDSSGQAYATSGNNLYRIDLATGTSTLVGSMGNGFNSSGDCVIDKTDGLYMTSTGVGGDDLVRINPSTGVGTLIGNIGVSNIWGLTSAWGYLFGFTGQGELVQIDKATGAGQILHAFPNMSFYGAASSSAR